MALFHKTGIKATAADLAKFDIDGRLKQRVSVYNYELARSLEEEIRYMHEAYANMKEKGLDMTSDIFEKEIADLKNPKQAERKAAGMTLLQRFERFIDDSFRDGIICELRYKHYRAVLTKLHRYLTINGMSQMAPAEFTEENFKICGRIYAAADGIELTQNDNTFRHIFKEATSTVVGSESNPTILQQQGIIAIDNVTRQDIYGHVKDVKTTYYKLPEDTWRPVKVNGEDFKGPAITTGPLDLTYDYRETSDRDPRVVVSKDGDKVVVSHANAKGGAGEHKSEITTRTDIELLKIGLGSKFTAPNFAWNASGHVDSYSTSVFELPTDLIQHKHFNVELTNGRSMIRSFTNTEFQDLAEADKARKFYDSDPVTGTFTAPSWTESMAFSGRLMANGFYQLIKDYKAGDASTLYRVIDESIKVYSGKKLNGESIIGEYNAANNRIELGQSGVHSNDGSVVYSAVAVNRYGITTAGAQILEFGTGEYVNEQWVSSEPSESLVIGGLFFRDIGPKRDNNGVV